MMTDTIIRLGRLMIFRDIVGETFRWRYHSDEIEESGGWRD